MRTSCRLALFLTALIALWLLPAPVHAAGMATLECDNVGIPVPGTRLYDTGVMGCASITGLYNIFSGIICSFMEVIDTVLSKMYCGLQYILKPVLAVALTLYVMVFGIMIATGYIQANSKEVITRLLKIAMIVAFATTAAWGIGLAFNFFIVFIQTGIGWMVTFLFPVDPGEFPGWAWERAIFLYIDQIIYCLILGPFTSAGSGMDEFCKWITPFGGNNSQLLGFIAVMGLHIAPLFALFFYFFLQALIIFIRALLTYLLGIAAIAFLIAISPIFLGFALFQPTVHLFESWLKYMISFALQIVLIFAVLALWFTVMWMAGDFFQQLSSVVVPYKELLWGIQVSNPVDNWGLCEYQFTPGVFPRLGCTGRPIIIPASVLITDNRFILWVFIHLTMLIILTYAFDTLMRNVPDLARQLSGPKYAPMLAGGHGPGALQPAGMSSLESLRDSGGGGIRKLFGGGGADWEGVKKRFGGDDVGGGAVKEFLRQQANMVQRRGGGGN